MTTSEWEPLYRAEKARADAAEAAVTRVRALCVERGDHDPTEWVHIRAIRRALDGTV